MFLYLICNKKKYNMIVIQVKNLWFTNSYIEVKSPSGRSIFIYKNRVDNGEDMDILNLVKLLNKSGNSFRNYNAYENVESSISEMQSLLNLSKL